ncbi:MAG: transglutaminase domain-containing protein, partial [Fimbriimonas ginsengisoli]|nr:transglutaminase domain-containing protein [Fimbriimonas ginsengisoli]
RWLKLDGVAYFILGVVAMFVAGPIGTALDGDIYHQTIATAGALEWMIVFCSFAAWRDSTLLFQFVPSMSLFGLVGCWDLYKAATVAFFVFLLGLATIFARAHGRLMMRQAELSGYSHVERLSAGPWKWIAGPEWALASAGAIIIVSLIGAPFLRETATAAGLAGTVKFQPPPTTRPLEGSLFPDRQGYVQIGRGPAILAKRPVLRVWVEGAKYLRSATYLDYVDDGWKARADASFGPRGIGSAALGRSYMREGQMISFSIEQIVPMAALPVPGEVVKINPERFLTRQGDGTYTISVTNGTGPLFTGRSLLPPDQPPPTKAATGLSSQYASLLADRSIPTKVKELADQWTAGATTDYAKARRIVDGISSRCKYNLLARPTPPGSDPVQFFLFQSKEGYCDLFASAVVLMARAEHIPARYAVGYLVNPE